MSFYPAKPRYERSNPIENIIPGPLSPKKYAQTGIDHTTRWKRIKPKTVIELCAEGKLEAAVVRTVLNLGVITRDKLRAELLKVLRRGNPSALKIVRLYAGVVF